MRSLLVATLLAAPAIASAGTYIGAAVGPSTNTGGDIEYVNNGRWFKGLVGYSIGQISIEAMVGRGGVSDANQIDVTQAALAGKYSFPLGSGFEIFGRLGYGRTWLSPSGDAPSTSGDGFLLGAGVEYRLKLVATQASLFLDYNVMTASLNGDDASDRSFNTRGFTIGATIGF